MEEDLLLILKICSVFLDLGIICTDVIILGGINLCILKSQGLNIFN